MFAGKSENILEEFMELRILLIILILVNLSYIKSNFKLGGIIKNICDFFVFREIVNI